MDEIINAIGLSKLFLGVHLVVLYVAYMIWSRRPSGKTWKTVFANILGVLSIPLSIVLALIFLFDGPPHAGTGNAASWYLIYSVVTLGIVPAITLFSFFLTGRIAGKIMYKRYAASQSTASIPEFGRRGHNDT
ncbi:MAG: hypothetical protein ACR2O3_00395 [Rhizobiaceae bacterium]